MDKGMMIVKEMEKNLGLRIMGTRTRDLFFQGKSRKIKAEEINLQ